MTSALVSSLHAPAADRISASNGPGRAGTSNGRSKPYARRRALERHFDLVLVLLGFPGLVPQGRFDVCADHGGGAAGLIVPAEGGCSVPATVQGPGGVAFGVAGVRVVEAEGGCCVQALGHEVDEVAAGAALGARSMMTGVQPA
ncbi:hypothetical protein ACIP5N_09860 [Streptomyces sp. NPDC088768]|uniref:hypothetical protein n=1 Tax=Streptomyces sp. NPDC088768 TaxID=3365894 RepID=UPI003815B130